MLGEHLRQLREERRLKQADLAVVIRASVSKISRLERGESPPKWRDVMDLARHMKLGPEDTRIIERLLDQSQAGAWYQQFSDVTPNYLKRLISLEAGASRIHSYENQVVPGLLQTRPYARSLVALARRSEAEIDRATDVRMRRQEILAVPRIKMTALIDQGVLLRPRGDKDVMREQLEHLLAVDATPGINIRVVEFAAGAAVTPPYAITQLEFPAEGPSDLVYVEHINGAEYITNSELVDDYRAMLHDLHSVAATRCESRQLILDTIREHYT
jgi:transcriptional regulator with XRE-family HTH domain